MAKSKFKITPFTNPSGSKVWRLSGTLNGERIRENFKTRNDAVARRQECTVKLLNDSSEGQTVWTTLTHEQNRDAIAAVNLLKSHGSKSSLTFAVNFLLKNYRPPEHEKAVSEAAMDYLEKRRNDYERGFIKERQFASIRSEMNWIEICLGNQPISTITPDDFREYLEKPKNGPRNRRPVPKATSAKTWNNRRGLVNTFCEYSLDKGYLGANPIKEVPQYKIKHRRGTAETLTDNQAATLMSFLESYTGPNYKRQHYPNQPAFLVPFFALALFAGIRPDWKNGEISKLDEKDIDLKTDVIRIEPEVSKIHEKRVIKIQPNLKLWLERYPVSQYPIIPPKNPDRIFSSVRKQFSLGHDVLRHTFISMTVGAFRSVGDASLQAGNSESVIRRHYLDLKSVEEADAFWTIVPKGAELPTMEKKDGRYQQKK
ncbi:MAG: site-specific integrase [Verrucomicrobia bacterium]|nr:site-specific integrase [Verrucomicrobiota bacterium]MDA1069380.1 site-specific integrase [Verrucomicrobiota bacterium]